MRKVFLIAWLGLLVVGTGTILLFPAREPRSDLGPSTPEDRTAQHFDSIRNQPDKLVVFLRNMPKGADLHTHLSGSIYAETFVSWAAQAKKCVDQATFELSEKCNKGQIRLKADLSKNDPVLYRRMIDAWSVRNWEHSGRTGHDQFFATFGRWGSLTVKTGEMMAEMRSRAAAGGISYLEVMLTPDGGESKLMGERLAWNDRLEVMRSQLLKAGLIDRAVGAGVESLNLAEQEMKASLRCGQAQADAGCNVEYRYIFQVGRANSPTQVFAQMLTAFEMASTDPRVVGLNLVQPEDHPIAIRDFSLHMRMLDYLHSIYTRVHIALHAGELAPGLVPPEALRFHIRESVETGHAERIGHGAALLHEDNTDNLVQEMAARNVMVEICLTSNDVILGIRGDRHPLRKYMKSGVPVALATDDEGVARSEITREYLKAVEDQGVSYSDLKRMARTSLEFAFIPGESLWLDARAFVLTPPCSKERPDASQLSAACKQFLSSSEKAKLQWGLEKSFISFEAQNQ